MPTSWAWAAWMDSAAKAATIRVRIGYSPLSGWFAAIVCGSGPAASQDLLQPQQELGRRRFRHVAAQLREIENGEVVGEDFLRVHDVARVPADLLEQPLQLLRRHAFGWRAHAATVERPLDE